eukprot:352048-Chlamydomonas_euryale.AAC.5
MTRHTAGVLARAAGHAPNRRQTNLLRQRRQGCWGLLAGCWDKPVLVVALIKDAYKSVCLHRVHLHVCMHQCAPPHGLAMHHIAWLQLVYSTPYDCATAYKVALCAKHRRQVQHGVPQSGLSPHNRLRAAPPA